VEAAAGATAAAARGRILGHKDVQTSPFRADETSNGESKASPTRQFCLAAGSGQLRCTESPKTFACSGEFMMDRINMYFLKLRGLVDDNEGQDMVEYALLAGFVAVAAGALLPAISSSISTIFSRMGSVLTLAAT
jgi:pilus assembly protein Flp/PilA